MFCLHEEVDFSPHLAVLMVSNQIIYLLLIPYHSTSLYLLIDLCALLYLLFQTLSYLLQHLDTSVDQCSIVIC